MEKTEEYNRNFVPSERERARERGLFQFSKQEESEKVRAMDIDMLLASYTIIFNTVSQL